MSAPQFNAPVLINTPDGTAVIDGPRAGIGAMTKLGLGSYNMSDSAWQKAFTLLVNATLKPTPKNLEDARQALEFLAFVTATRH